jgi:uncharacterized protein YhfF
VEVTEDLVQLGFEGDDGLGELLLGRLLAGSLSVLWEPVDLLDEGDADEMRDATGEVLTVLDSEGEPACNVRVVDVFETTWGDPDPRLVAGEGYGRDVEAWRGFAGPALADGLAEEDLELTDRTELLVQQVEVLEIASDAQE